MDIELIKTEAIRQSTDWDNYTAPRIQAVRYIKEQTGMDLIQAKRQLETWENELILIHIEGVICADKEGRVVSVISTQSGPYMQKVITWHSVSELPEEDTECNSYSKYVLLRQGEDVTKGYYFFDHKQWRQNNDQLNGFQPTHWAYIDSYQKK